MKLFSLSDHKTEESLEENIEHPIYEEGKVLLHVGNIKRPNRGKKKPTYSQNYNIYTAYDLLSNCVGPCSFDEAIKSGYWKNAIESELKSHEEHGHLIVKFLCPCHYYRSSHCGIKEGYAYVC